MLKKSLLLAVTGAFAVAAATPALATTVTSGSGTITSTDSTQTNRVFRDSNPSTWATPKAFPGVFEQSPTYYDLVNATFSSNALQTIYYEITYTTKSDGSAGLPFAVGYQDSFNPSNLATNYLGDSGASAIVGQPAMFQVIVGAGHQLLLDFQDANGFPTDYSYSVSAYSDANRGQNFLTAATPEPGTWAMMIVGLGIAGVALRRRLRASDVRFDARIKRIAAGELA